MQESITSENKGGLPFWRFAQFFKSYGIALGIIVAAIPFVTQGLDLLPIYASNKNILTFITSLMSLLVVALLFSNRRRVGNHVFPSGGRTISSKAELEKRIWQFYAPLGMIALSLLCLIIYIATINASVEKAALKYGYEVNTGRSLNDILTEMDDPKDFVEANLFGLVEQEARVNGQARTVIIEGEEERKLSINFLSERGIELVLELTPSVGIPYDWVIYISYLVMFIGAAMAFVWLGIIEYIQDVLKLEDSDLLENPYKKALSRLFKIPEIKDISEDHKEIYFSLEYDPEAKKKKIISGPDGPFCEQHGQKLQSPIHYGDRYMWFCVRKVEKQTVSHPFILEYDQVDIIKLRSDAANKEIKSLSQ